MWGLVAVAALALVGCDRAVSSDEAADATSTPAVTDEEGLDAAATAASAAGPFATFRLQGGRLHRGDGSSWDQPLELDHVGGARIGDAFQDGDWLEDWEPVADENVGSGAIDDAGAVARCMQYTSQALPPGLSMLVEDGTITRFELAPSGTPLPIDYALPFGLRIGQPQAAALAALPPDVEVAAHEFQAPGRASLNWHDAATGLGLQAETADGAVVAVRWGSAGAALRAEGCT